MKSAVVALFAALASAASIPKVDSRAALDDILASSAISKRSLELAQRIKARDEPFTFGKGLPGQIDWKPDPNAPKSLVPDVTSGKGIAFPDATRRKIRYGPYHVPSTKAKNAQAAVMKENGMADYYVTDAQKPCEECVILMVNADLEYADGSKANVSTGAWLHHTVVMNTGPNVLDTNCQKSHSESIFESGNERTEIPLSLGDQFTVKTGYRIHPENKFMLINEFQNQKDEDQWVWLTLDYEVFDSTEHDLKDWRSTKMLWLSLGNNICNWNQPNPFGPSNLTAMGEPKEKIFTEASIPWTSPYEGIIIGGGGHLHDGGTHLWLYHNGEEMCDATPEYGPVGADGEKHISNMDACISLQPFKKGDTFHLRADYDMTEHKGQEDNMGGMSAIMGIAAILLAV